jgi:hypothetical protein
MAVRSVPAAQAVRDRVLAEAPGARLDVMELDLSSAASVRAFASEFVSRGLPLNILMYVCYSSVGIVACCPILICFPFYQPRLP